MQIQAQCVSCLIHRGFEETQLATSDQAVQMQVMTELVNILQRVLLEGGRLERIPAYFGTLRDHNVQRITGCPDPYATIRQQSNETALRFLPQLQALVDASNSQADKFRQACAVASLGNIIEYGVQGHVVPWEELEVMVTQAQSEMAIDQIDQLYQVTQQSQSILYLADNAGEIVFDRVLIQVLTEFGIEVTVAVKGSPVLNDAILADATAAGLDDLAQVITTGGGAIGVLPQWCSREFLSHFDQVDLIIAKGMAHTETLPEYTLPKPTALLLRTKCEVVARYLGVPKGRNIVKLLKQHKGPLGLLTSAETAS